MVFQTAFGYIGDDVTEIIYLWVIENFELNYYYYHYYYNEFKVQNLVKVSIPT